MRKLPSPPISQVSGNTLCDQAGEPFPLDQIPDHHRAALALYVTRALEVLAAQDAAAALAAQEEAA